MAMKYIKVSSLPRVDDPILNRALEQLDEELGRIAKVFIDWTADAGANNIHDDNILSSSITQHEGDIDHDALTNTHNLTTDIDHDLLTNFAATEHFLQSAITTVGTIGTGIWQGTAIANAYVAGIDQDLLTTSSPIHVTAKLTALSDGYVPYHVNDATGLANSPIRISGTYVGVGVVPGNALHVAGNIQVNTTSQKIHSNIWEVISSTADMKFRIGSTDAMIIQKVTRNVGIGKTPTERLDVDGNVKATQFILGSYYLDDSGLVANNKVADSDKWDGYQFADYLDQAVKQASSPTLNDLTISTPVNIYALSHNLFADYAANRHVVLPGTIANVLSDHTLAIHNALNITQLGIVATGIWQGTAIADGYIATSANWNTAYNHSQNHSQAHTDYLKNNANDVTSGNLSVGYGRAADSKVSWYESTTERAKIWFDISTNDFIVRALQDDLRLEASAGNVVSLTIEGNTTAASATCRIAANTGVFLRSTSAKKYKDRIKDLELDSSLLYNLRPVSFNSLCKGDDKDKRFAGLIADEIEQIYPEIVHYNEKHEAESYDNQMLMTLMLKEIQNLNQRVSRLEN